MKLGFGSKRVNFFEYTIVEEGYVANPNESGCVETKGNLYEN
jgi:hypothetical protein